MSEPFDLAMHRRRHDRARAGLRRGRRGAAGAAGRARRARRDDRRRRSMAGSRRSRPGSRRLLDGDRGLARAGEARRSRSSTSRSASTTRRCACTTTIARSATEPLGHIVENRLIRGALLAPGRGSCAGPRWRSRRRTGWRGSIAGGAAVGSGSTAGSSARAALFAAAEGRNVADPRGGRHRRAALGLRPDRHRRDDRPRAAAPRPRGRAVLPVRPVRDPADDRPALVDRLGGREPAGARSDRARRRDVHGRAGRARSAIGWARSTLAGPRWHYPLVDGPGAALHRPAPGAGRRRRARDPPDRRPGLEPRAARRRGAGRAGGRRQAARARPRRPLRCWRATSAGGGSIRWP